MRTLKVTALVTLVFTMLSPIAHAQSRDHSWLFGQSLPDKEPDAAYALETKGWNTRVYEWTPETAPDKTCIVQFADAGPAGMFCFDKEDR